MEKTSGTKRYRDRKRVNKKGDEIMTKNELKAKLTLAVNMAEQTKTILDEICDELAPYAEDDIFDMVNEIQSCERSDVNEMMRELEKNDYLSDANITETGCPIPTPYIKYSILGNTEVGITYPDGDKLAAYLCESDFGTYQTGSMYYTRTGSPLELTLAEIKKGELAKIAGRSADNRDIDVMVWSDPYNEDYTNKFTLSYDDIETALEAEDLEMS